MAARAEDAPGNKYAPFDGGPDVEAVRKQQTLSASMLARTRTQTMLLSLLCLVQFVTSLVWLADGASEPLYEERVYSVGGALLLLLSSILGFFGGFFRARAALLVFFINQLWGLALITTRLYIELRDARLQSEYCAHVPPGLPSDELELDCTSVHGKIGRRMTGALFGAAAQWAGAFVAHRLSENLQDRSATTEDARLVELILRVKSELQQSSTEFEEFVCKRLDDVEEQLGHTHAQPAPGGRPG